MHCFAALFADIWPLCTNCARIIGFHYIGDIGVALSEKQIPQIAENIGNQYYGRS